MIYRPSRELLSESLADSTDVQTWQQLYQILDETTVPWVKKPLEITWEAQGYDKRVESDVWIVCLRDKNYGGDNAWGHIHGDPSTLPGYIPQVFTDAPMTPVVDNPIQKYHTGDRVRVCRIGHPMWEGDKVYDMNPKLVGKLATVEYSYTDRYGGRDKKHSYSLKFDDGGSSAWYEEYQMEPIDTEELCTETYPSAAESNTGKAWAKMVQDMEDELMWGISKKLEDEINWTEYKPSTTTGGNT